MSYFPYHALSEMMVKGAHVKVKPLIDYGSSFDIFGIQLVVLSIGVNQVESTEIVHILTFNQLR